METKEKVEILLRLALKSLDNPMRLSWLSSLIHGLTTYAPKMVGFVAANGAADIEIEMWKRDEKRETEALLETFK